MKKNLLVLILAVAAFGFSGCKEEDSSKADLKWSNASGANVQDIKWMSGGSADQSWDGITAPAAATEFKGISALAGTGDCLDENGAAATIVLDPATSSGTTTISSGAATIAENADAVLVISSAKKK